MKKPVFNNRNDIRSTETALLVNLLLQQISNYLDDKIVPSIYKNPQILTLYIRLVNLFPTLESISLINFKIKK